MLHPLPVSRRALPAVLAVLALASRAAAFPLTIGVSGGSTIPNLHAQDDNPISKGWASRFAPTFGLSAEVPFTPMWSLRTGLDYAPQGAKRDGMQPAPGDYSALGIPPGTTIWANYKNTQKLDYLEVPVLARARFGGARRFFAELGPYAGFLIAAKNETRGMSSLYYDEHGTQPVEIAPGVPLPPQDFSGDTDVSGDVHHFNWGLQGGLGGSYPLGRGVLQLEARGGYGLAVVQKDTATNGKNNTGDLQIAIGFTIPIDRLRGR